MPVLIRVSMEILGRLAYFKRPARLAALALLLASLACSLPFASTPTPTRWSPSATPTVQPTATPTPAPQPPALVESDPPVSAELPLNGPLTLYFNQDMDRASVEATLRSQMGEGLAFTWVDNSTVVVYLTAPLQPDTELSVLVSDGMRSNQGKPLLQPVSLNYRTAGYLAVSMSLPEPNAQDVDPSGAVVAAFNRPIVALGAGSNETLPVGFTLSPAAEGQGVWINTSTYAFYPEPALSGGVQYTVEINPNLKSTDGGPLRDASSWSFTTARPRMLSLEPAPANPWPLDSQVVLKFNQPMDAAAVESAFSLVEATGTAISGKFEWNTDGDTLTFTPAALLMRSGNYRLSVSTEAKGRGGTPLDQPLDVVFTTVEALRVTRTDPSAGSLEPNSQLSVFFSAPLKDEELLQWVTFEPSVTNLSAYWDENEYALRLNGAFAPNTDYTLRLSPDLPDRWGGTLGQEYTYAFSTGPYQPNLNLVAQSSTIFLTGLDAALRAQAVNLTDVAMSLDPLLLAEFIAINGPSGYEQMEALKQRQTTTWTQTLNAAPDRMGPVNIYLNRDQTPLAPNIYYFYFNFPQGDEATRNIYGGPFLLVVSNLQMTIKAGVSDALVWVTDVTTGTPTADAPITLYDEKGTAIAQGRTDAEGFFQTTFDPLENPYGYLYAVVNQPGEPNFGMALSSWSAGIEAWDFGINSSLERPGLKTYFYTDRPIYRPGQKVYFRAIVRNAFNGRYTPPEISVLPVIVSGSEGQQLAAFDLPISPLGTAHGEFDIPAEASPGYYSISTKDQVSPLNFQVASYRKPEINLQAAFSDDEAQAGEPLSATINARYFFDAPVGNQKLHWSLYVSRAYFSLPGYQVGREDITWMDPFRLPEWYGALGQFVKEGEVKTGADGTAVVEIPTEPTDELQEYALEVTTTDESGLPVSTRTSTLLNPDAYYIGVRPDNWVGRSDEEAGFEIQTVNWQKDPDGERELRAVFQKVTWKRVPPPANQLYGTATYEPEYTSIGSTDLITGPDGKARVAFTPPDPGTYMLDVFNRQSPDGQGARTQALLWVGGAGQATWPNLPNSRLQLTADRDEYQPGDTAQVFIPNPFGRDVQALITLERSMVMHHELVTVPAEGQTLTLNMKPEFAPNVYLSVTLLSNEQGRPDFRQGYLNLAVSPAEHVLQVAVTGQPQRAGPGDEVSFEIQVTDSAGAPVQGEFSLAVADLAALALADPNAPDIVSAFYGEQALGVRTGMALAAYNQRQLELPGGLGGGGGAEAAQVARENFPDTAYWNAQVQTGADGKAQVSITLPDTLTTWQVDTRGVTTDTRVGQAQTQVVTTKDLLIRPVTPRFFVANDHVQAAAVVQNNTDRELTVQVTLQAGGFRLDDLGAQAQQATIPANGRVRVEWWGTVEDVETVDLVFSAEGGGLQDAARPALGALPVLRYFTPQAYRTSGVMDTGGEITEMISLPRSFDPQSGQLSVELSPSLAAAMVRALDVLETQPYESTEAALSSFLPNLETYRTLQQFGVEDAGLKSKLDRSLNSGIQRLLARQNFDGGWGWWKGNESDAFITTYVVFGLLRAREAGISITPEVIQKAVTFLQEGTSLPQGGEAEAPLPWHWDRMAFQSYVLSEAGSPDPAVIDQILSERDQLSPWAKALLALTIERQQPGSEQAKTILSDLQSAVVRSASGAFWPLEQDDEARMSAGYNMQTDLSNTAVTLFALAQRDPGSPLVGDITRYLMASRNADGAWNSSFTTAWTLIALNEVMKGTGEMAGQFTFDAALNSNPFAQGQASDAKQVNPVTAQAPVSQLYADYPNTLLIRRGAGPGRLYYTAGLEVSRPVEDVAPLSQGLNIERGVFPFGDACPDRTCAAISAAAVGQKVTVRLSLTLPNPVHYLAVSDYIPAGAEILDVTLKTSELGIDGEPQTQANYDPRRPFDQGWGWWLFNAPQIYDDHILWTANYLPEGSYELTYTLALLQPGQFRVLPARAWQIYFPDVQANSAGSLFEITP